MNSPTLLWVYTESQWIFQPLLTPLNRDKKATSPVPLADQGYPQDIVMNSPALVWIYSESQWISCLLLL